MTPPSLNLHLRPVDNSEESGAFISNDEELPETPQLELRKPGHVVKSVVKEVHHVELPAIRLNVRPKVQVRDHLVHECRALKVGPYKAGKPTGRLFL